MRLVQGNNQSGAIGGALSTALKVQVFNAGTTTTAAGVVVEWVDPTAPTVVVATSTTDSTGTASYTWTMGSLAGPAQLTARVRSEPRAAVTFSATATADTSTGSIAAVTATSQTATKGTAVGVPPSVVVTDTQGNLVSGKDVVFTMTAGSGTLSPASPATVTTDANGLATLTSWTLGAAAGTNTVTAALAGYTGSPVTFNATGANALPTQIAKTSGDAQTNVTAGAAATAFTATVKDAGNTAVQNVDVLWTIVTGAGTLTGGQTTATATTNASGVSTTTLTTNATVGSFSVTASFVDATGTTRSVTFTGSTVAGASTKWLIRTQPSSNVSSGTPFSQQPILYLADANSNAVATAGVVCTAARASGSDTLAGTLTATTDSTGTATFVNLTFNVVGAGGANTLQFTGGSKTAATSNTVTVAPPVPVAVLWGTQPSTTTTGAVMAAFTVRVVDNTNATVPADTSLVTIALVGSGTASGTLSVNASGGVATFSNVTVTGTGTFSFDATCSTFPVVRSSAFTVNAQSTSHPNEPSGMTLVTEVDMTSNADLLANGWVLTSTGRLHYEDPSTYPICSQFTRLTTSTARANYIGVKSGNGAIGISKSTTNVGATLYLDFDFAVDAAWDGDLSGVGKIFFLCAQNASAQPIYLDAHGIGSNLLSFQVHLQGCAASKGGNFADGSQNVSCGANTVVRGTKVRVEVAVTMNSVDGSGNANADGTLDCWLDGVNKIHKTTMAYRGNDSAFVGPTAKFNQLKWNPTWGGQSGVTNQVDMNQFIGYVYWSMK